MIYQNLGVNEAGHLTFAGLDTTQLAEEYGTALMLMDESVIRNRCRTYRKAMAEHLPAGSMHLYSSKALSFKRMYEIMRDRLELEEMFRTPVTGFAYPFGTYSDAVIEVSQQSFDTSSGVS